MVATVDYFPLHSKLFKLSSDIWVWRQIFQKKGLSIKGLSRLPGVMKICLQKLQMASNTRLEPGASDQWIWGYSLAKTTYTIFNQETMWKCEYFVRQRLRRFPLECWSWSCQGSGYQRNDSSCWSWKRQLLILEIRSFFAELWILCRCQVMGIFQAPHPAYPRAAEQQNNILRYRLNDHGSWISPWWKTSPLKVPPTAPTLLTPPKTAQLRTWKSLQLSGKTLILFAFFVNEQLSTRSLSKGSSFVWGQTCVKLVASRLCSKQHMYDIYSALFGSTDELGYLKKPLISTSI